MKKTAVVILNCNGEKYLRQFLGKVVRNSPEADVVLIDNLSNDNSIRFIEEYFPSVKIIQLDKNYGFAEGYNLGLEKLSHENFLLLNSDVEVSENWLDEMLEILNSDPKIKVVQPKILDFNNRDKFEYGGAAGGFLDLFGYAFCRGRIFDTIEEDKNQYPDTTELFWASGACFLIKAETLKKYGGFDSRFFAHMEEIDLCWRILNEGGKIAYASKSTVYHIGGGTLDYYNPKKSYLNFRNNLAMLFKNIPTRFLFPIIFIRLVLDGISGVRFIFQGNFANCFSIIRAHFTFYSWLPYLIKRRSKNFAGFTKLYSRSIVWDYFVLKKKTFEKLCSK